MRTILRFSARFTSPLKQEVLLLLIADIFMVVHRIVLVFFPSSLWVWVGQLGGKRHKMKHDIKMYRYLH